MQVKIDLSGWLIYTFEMVPYFIANYLNIMGILELYLVNKRPQICTW